MLATSCLLPLRNFCWLTNIFSWTRQAAVLSEEFQLGLGLTVHNFDRILNTQCCCHVSISTYCNAITKCKSKLNVTILSSTSQHFVVFCSHIFLGTAVEIMEDGDHYDPPSSTFKSTTSAFDPVYSTVSKGAPDLLTFKSWWNEGTALNLKTHTTNVCICLQSLYTSLSMANNACISHY